MVTVPSVELTLTQFQNVHVLLITSQICTKVKKFAKFVTSDVETVLISSTTVSTVLNTPEDLVPHTVTVQLDSSINVVLTTTSIH
jgi:hypothetical protein